MKRFILILILTLSIQSWTKADDIRDFEIEGMSLGDSLLDFFSKDDLVEAAKKVAPYKHGDYYIEQLFISKKFRTYDAVKLTYIALDKNYYLYGIAGLIYFESDFDNCLKTQKKVVKSIIKLFPDVDKNVYDKTISHYDKSKKSYYIETNFEFKDESMVRVYCNNWSEELTKKNGWKDSLNVIMNDISFLEYLRKTYQ